MAESISSSPIVVSVLAANGQQSSSVVTHLLSLGSDFSQNFRLRAIVRDPSKYASPSVGQADNGKTHNEAPDEIIAGDMDSAESLDQALQGTDVLWAMTTFNTAKGMEAEITQGKSIIDAFTRCTTNRTASYKPLLLFSSAMDVDAVTKGEIKMVNSTSKAKIEAYLHSLPKNVQDTFSVTFVHPGMFMQNFTTYQKPTIDDAGVYHFTCSLRPDVQLPFVDITDLGPLVWHLIKTAYLSGNGPGAYKEYDRASIRLYGQYLSYPQLVEQFSKATGLPAVYDHMSTPKFLSVLFNATENEVKRQLDPGTRQNDQETMITIIGDMYNLCNRYGYYSGDAPGMEEFQKDIRMQKVIQQQITRRTTWVEFVEKNFARSTRQDTTTTVLSLPTNFPGATSFTKAQRFLYEHISYFVKVCQAGPDAPADFEKDVLPKFHPDAVIEFPYFPKELRDMLNLRPLSSDAARDGALLIGHGEILGYFKDWRQTFMFEKGELLSLSSLSSSTSERLATADGAAIEARLTGTVTQAGVTKPYVQDYMCFAFLDEEGQVVRYQEYWDPTRFTD